EPISLTSFDFGPAPGPPFIPPSVLRPPSSPSVRESFGGVGFDPFFPGPPYALFDDAPNWPAGLGRGASGTVGDRRAGRDLPVFWSELDLRGFRVMSRWLWDTNPFMQGFGARLTDYHVGKGYRWQACLTGRAKQAYATAAAVSEGPEGRLITRAQNILDGWRDRVHWPLRSREGFRRLRRDGEVIQRFGRSGTGLLPWVRWVNPEQVGSPTGDTTDDGSFGVRTAAGDTEHVTDVYIRDHDGGGTTGEWAAADVDDPMSRVVFFKTNTDADVKRGLPDSFSVSELLDESRKLVRNMAVVACAQAAVSWLEKFPTASAEQVRALIPTGSPRVDLPPWANGGAPVYSEKLAAGTVLRTEGGREFAPGPVSTGVASFVEAEQAALRAVCVRWGLPPYLTAKADDINFASSLTAGSPFAVAVEGGQVEWAAVERATALKVLDLAAESGLLTPAERRQLDVEVIPPTVTSPDPGAETERNKILFDAKVLDPYTWMQREGLDPAHVEANWKAWHARNPDPPAGGPAAPPGGLPGVVAREEKLRPGFTGIAPPDEAGRVYRYVNGRRVKKGRTTPAGKSRGAATAQPHATAATGGKPAGKSKGKGGRGSGAPVGRPPPGSGGGGGGGPGGGGGSGGGGPPPPPAGSGGNEPQLIGSAHVNDFLRARGHEPGGDAATPPDPGVARAYRDELTRRLVELTGDPSATVDSVLQNPKSSYQTEVGELILAAITGGEHRATGPDKIDALLHFT
ncbi:MAG TPA: hypothetical protein VH092_34940, partial [Urbifossiella sp.]|nr:hypothetical protein [Urbifossiella sp.]